MDEKIIVKECFVRERDREKLEMDRDGERGKRKRLYLSSFRTTSFSFTILLNVFNEFTQVQRIIYQIIKLSKT